MSELKLVTFFDTVGRTIIAGLVDQDNETLTVRNPVIVHVVPNQNTGQMALQLLPVFFKEFLADRNEDTEWTYKKAGITQSNDPELDFRLKSQYETMFSNIEMPNKNIVTPQEAAQEAAQESASDETPDNVVNMFDN